ncbi:uncharacterized protein MONOS_1108 [Monocercomonoides exilis]|uniref:uncharacterized protein n=1 Tax=Monocercomonoides exilis TaxID=2049356 RepID=UPI00355A5D0E|nr:hypothetical protein MONOS_1108 [Monocercomonoides exilis]
MNKLIEEMDECEFNRVFSEELFDKMHKMILEKKLSMENACLLAKHIGHYKALKEIWFHNIETSSLNKSFEMTIEEEARKRKMNGKLLTDLCESHLLMQNRSVDLRKELLLIYVRCLLNAASSKEEDEETQKEVEMALFALNNMNEFCEVKGALHFKAIAEIIKYHQEHRNMTRIAYHSIWEYFINVLNCMGNIRGNMKELHFEREAAKELEELTEQVNWKKKEWVLRESKEVKLIVKWLEAIRSIGGSLTTQKGEFVMLETSITNLCRAAKGSHREIYRLCILLFVNRIFEAVKYKGCLLSEEAVDFFLEEFHQPTIDHNINSYCLSIFEDLSKILSRKKETRNEENERFSPAQSWTSRMTEEEREEAKQKMMVNRKLREKMEEDGYEDIVVSFYGSIVKDAKMRGRAKGLDDRLIYC